MKDTNVFRPDWPLLNTFLMSGPNEASQFSSPGEYGHADVTETQAEAACSHLTLGLAWVSSDSYTTEG